MLLDHWRVERGIPASKLVLGLPAYGRGFKGAKRYGHVEKNSSAHTSYGYNELMQRASQGWTIKHLDNGEAWLIAPDQSEIIGFDDPAAITAKCQWAGELGLGGVFFWEGTQDIMPDGSTPLLDAAASAVAAWSTQP
jgi:chitinase